MQIFWKKKNFSRLRHKLAAMFLGYDKLISSYVAITKEKIYVNKPQALEELKANIQPDIKALEPETLKTVKENALESLCNAENWRKLKDVIFIN